MSWVGKDEVVAQVWAGDWNKVERTLQEPRVYTGPVAPERPNLKPIATALTASADAVREMEEAARRAAREWELISALPHRVTLTRESGDWECGVCGARSWDLDIIRGVRCE